MIVTTRELDLPLEPEEATKALRLAVEEWGGGFREVGGAQEFAVPVQAGIRVGYAQIRPLVEATRSGSRMRLEVTEEVLHVNRSALVILLLGAGGGIVTMLGPLHDSLLRLVPVGAILALLAWFMVASRARSAGPEELLQTVAEIVAQDSQADE